MAKQVPARPEFAVRIERLRKLLKKSQVEFAELLSVGQGNVSKWERGANKPTPDMLTRIAKLAPDVDKFYFLDQAGVPSSFFMGDIEKRMPSRLVAATSAVVGEAFGDDQPIQAASVKMVPVLADGVAAGDGRIVNEKDVEEWVPLPASWFKNAADVYIINIDGDSMEPMLRDGDQALVDVSQRDPKKLAGEMVAAIVGDGVTVKFLRRYGRFYQLVPLNTSPRHEIKILGEADQWGVVGKVVKWIGEPPPPPKKAR